MATDNPAALFPHDPAWPARAQSRLTAIRDALRDLDGAADARFEHIGSTSVPGLRAKPILDLQVAIQPLPDMVALEARLAPLGYVQARGSRPDSPGVTRDIPRGNEVVSDEVWRKRMLIDRDGTVILHVRRQDSPWSRYPVWFRDWLRAHDAARDEYARVKQELSAENAGKADYDDYTRAKTAFFDEVHDDFVAWAQARAGARAGAGAQADARAGARLEARARVEAQAQAR